MTSPLPGYGKGLTDDLILGHVAWYTITKPRLTHDQIMSLVTDLGLDANIIPKPPRAGDAFKRACRYSERNGLPVPYSDNTANFMIRAVAQTITEVERHLMLEIVDPNGRRLEYHKAAELQFDRGTSVLSVSAKAISKDMDELTQEKYNDKLEALESFTERCGDGSGFHTIPLFDDSKQQALIASAFEEGVHEQATQIIVELQQHTDTEKPMTVNAWNDYRQKFKALTEKSEEYADLVDTELSKAELELELLGAHLNDFLMTGNIKTKGDASPEVEALPF